MRSNPVLLSLAVLCAVILAAVMPASFHSGPARSYASAADARCKTVIKKVHGKKKKVRVCKKAKPTPTPVPTTPPKIFAGPSDLVIDAHGNALVADQKAGSILTISPEGKKLATWTNAGTQPATFGQLYGIALDPSGNVYVSDAQYRVIDKLDPTGSPLAQISTEVAASHSFPTLLVVGPNGDIYVSSHQVHAVLRLSPTGALLGLIGKGDLGDPYGIAFGPDGNLYVSDFVAGGVREYTPEGKSVATWGNGLNGTVGLQDVEAIAVDSSGDIYVTEQIGRVIKFDRSGHQLAGWGNDGVLDLNDPSGIALDPAGNIYVAEYMGDRIDKLSPTGQLLAVWQ